MAQVVPAPSPLRRLLLATVVFASLDALWLSLLMSDFYSRMLGDLARRSGAHLDPVWWAALLVYVVLIGGLVLFALPRATSAASALGWGALFGLATYGTYDLTCQAVLRDWPVVMTFVDITWGATLCGVTALAVVAVEQWVDGHAMPRSS